MTPQTPPRPEPEPSSRDEARLAQARLEQARLEQATRALRDHVDQRWVEISDRVLATALTVTRRSLPVLAQAPGGPVHVSEQVLVTYLRDAVSVVADARIEEILIATGDAGTYTGVTISISARYGMPLLPIADRIRDLATARLQNILGPIAPPVTVTTMHVHIADVHRV